MRPLKIAFLAALPLLVAHPALAEETPPATTSPAPVPAAPEPAPIAVPAAPAPLAAPANDLTTEPLAGYNGSFFLRDPHNWFVLFPKGRLQIDGYYFPLRGDAPSNGAATNPMPVPNNSARDSRPKDTIFVRRARAELQGTFMNHFDFHIAGEFASTPATGSYGTVADAYVIVDYLPYLKLQAGQFDAPFTLENRTSDKYFDFMERSIVVRSFGVPSNKEDGAMLWGWLPRNFAYYSIGVFNGDGQSFKAQDNNPAVIGRAFVAPFTLMAGDRKWMNDIWIGGSIWWRNVNNLGGTSGVAANTGGAAQNDIAGMSTQGGFGFFSSNYGNGKDANMNAVRSHLAPNGQTLKWALEANIPISRFGLRFEMVGQSIDLSRYDDTNPPTGAALVRTGPISAGNLSGLGYYIEAYGWILGDVNFIETPGIEAAPRLKRYKAAGEPKWGLMVAAKYEHVGFDIKGITDPTLTTTKDPSEGHYAVDVLELGVNGWATKHVRLTLNYVINFIGGFGSSSATPTAGDAVNITKNLYYGKTEQELLLRLGIAL